MHDSTPTGAHQALMALLPRVLLEVARRRQDELPGLVETLQDHVVVTTGGTRRRALGLFTEEAWRYGNRQVHEVFLNADRRHRHPGISDAEDVLTTLVHEGCHVWAKANGIRDTSRDGRWHNKRFAQIAIAIGLDVERDPGIGHRTPGLSTRGRSEYFDLLSELEQVLLLAREPRPPEPEPGGEELTGGQGSLIAATEWLPPTSKYIFASCTCQDGRGRKVTIRVAKGSWRPHVIRCDICQSPFQES